MSYWVQVVLDRAPDDPKPFSDENQAELRAVDESLRKLDRNFRLAQHPAAWGLVGQFVVTLGPPVVAAVAAVAGAWVQARYGRKVRVKFGDIEAEARTPEEVEELLKRAAEFKDSRQKPSADI